MTLRGAGDWLQANAWALKTWLLGGIGSAADYSLVWILAERLSVPTFAATLAGLLLGNGVNFVVFRWLIFQQARQVTAASQAIRFAVLMAALVVAHAFSVAVARDNIGVPLFLAKVGADLFYFGPGYPFLLRRVVFSR
jgi:putative flippase GtrA